MADDLDKTVLEAADNYTKTAPPQQAINLPKLPPTIQKIKTISPLEEAAPYLAHPIETAKGFFSTINPAGLAHPIDLFKADWGARMAALDRLRSRGSKIITSDPASPEAGEDLRNMFEWAVPGFGPAMANAGRSLQSESGPERARGFGSALALTSGPKIISKTLHTLPTAVAIAKSLPPKLVPEQLPANLINKAVGEGAIEPKYGKDLGRGLARAKQGALTRGQAAQPSAGITRETGLTKGVNAGLDEAARAKESLLQHPAGQAKNIDGIKFIEDNFGPIQNNPITGVPEVNTVAPTNVPESTTAQFNEFGNRLLKEMLQRGGKLSAADVEAMRKAGVIDPNYGSFSTEAPDLALNQKAGRVSSALIKSAEDAVRLPSGQSALELLNSHMADLMQGKKILPEKLAAGRMEAPNTLNILNAINPMSYLRKAVAETVKPAPGFNAGAIGMPIRTGLASALTEKPWWLTNPTRGLPIPNTAPPEAGLPSVGSSGEAGPNPTNPVQSNFPAQPMHIEEGQRVTGSDVNGTTVSGDVKKIYAVVDKNSGTPQWKALVLDNSKGKVVEIPAEQAIPTENQITTLTKQAGEAQAKAVPRTKTRPQEIVESLRKDMESRGPVTVPSSSPIREIQDRGFKRYNPGVPDLETVAPQTKTGPSTESPFKQGDIVKFNHGGEIYKGNVSSEVQQSKKGPYVIVNRWPAPYTGQYNVLVKDLKN